MKECCSLARSSFKILEKNPIEMKIGSRFRVSNVPGAKNDFNDHRGPTLMRI